MCLFSFLGEQIRFLDDGGSMMSCVSLLLSHTQQQSGCCFVLFHKHSHRRGAANRLPPFTYYPPPAMPLEVVLGQKRVAHLTLPLPSPNFTQLHTHTDWNIGAHTNRTHPVNSCTRGDKLGSLSTKRGWGTPTLHTHTQNHPASLWAGSLAYQTMHIAPNV